MVPRSILFITTSNLATNPRLVKELRTCIELGHKATVLFFEFSHWSTPLNDQLKVELGRKAILKGLAGDRQSTTAWLLSSLANRLSKILLPLMPKSRHLLSISLFKRSALIMLELKNHNYGYDCVIAHNPGAFLPSLLFAKKKNIKLGIDLEDFHPGESSNPDSIKKLEKLVRKTLAGADVVTAASTLILAHSIQLRSESQAVTAVVNNVFPLKLQPAWKTNKKRPLKLIWFSQNVGLDRGIQDVIFALNAINKFEIMFTIVGNCSRGTEMHLSGLLKNGGHQLRFKPPMNEKHLIEECSRYHIGLALETSEPLNRDLCLTNKLFVYLLAGNAIVASQTAAQKEFLNDHPAIGQLYPVGDYNQLAAVLSSYYEHPHLLNEHRVSAYQLAKAKYNWDMEAQQWAKLYGLN